MRGKAPGVARRRLRCLVARTKNVGCLAGVALAFGACGGGGNSDDLPDAGPVADGNLAPDFTRSPAFVDVRTRTFGPDQGDALVRARMVTTADPTPYEFGAVQDGCRAAARRTCTPACDVVELCDGGGTCHSLDDSLDAGPVSVTGGVSPITLAHADGYVFYEGTPIISADDAITATASAGALGDFSATDTQPAAIELIDIEALTLAVGQPLTIRWTPAQGDTRVRISLGADLGHAQYRSYLVECDLPDAAGEVTIPQAFVDELADPTNWSCGDCFSHEVARYRVARTTSSTGADVELRLMATASLYLTP